MYVHLVSPLSACRRRAQCASVALVAVVWNDTACWVLVVPPTVPEFMAAFQRETRAWEKRDHAVSAARATMKDAGVNLFLSVEIDGPPGAASALLYTFELKPPAADHVRQRQKDRTLFVGLFPSEDALKAAGDALRADNRHN